MEEDNPALLKALADSSAAVVNRYLAETGRTRESFMTDSYQNDPAFSHVRLYAGPATSAQIARAFQEDALEPMLSSAATAAAASNH